jgi:hypothetical protein
MADKDKSKKNKKPNQTKVNGNIMENIYVSSLS